MVKIFDKRFFLYVLENIVNFKNIFSSIGIHFSWYSIYLILTELGVLGVILITLKIMMSLI